MEKSLICEMMMKVIRGVDPASCVIHYIGRKTNFPYLNKLTDSVCENILQSCAVEAFAKSNPENVTRSKDGVPLGDIAINLVMYITGLTESSTSATELISAHPTLQAYGLVEEMYMD